MKSQIFRIILLAALCSIVLANKSHKAKKSGQTGDPNDSIIVNMSIMDPKNRGKNSLFAHGTPLLRTVTHHNQVEFILGAYSSTDKMTHVLKYYKYLVKSDVQIKFSGRASTQVTCVRVRLIQPSDYSEGFTMDGGIGLRYIDGVIQVYNTDYVLFDVDVYTAAA